VLPEREARKETTMGDKVYKKIRVTGCSEKSLESAIEAAVEKASKSVHGMGWFEMTEVRGAIKDGKVGEWQVSVDIGFKLD
jgi:flavin-binding protein dodecin